MRRAGGGSGVLGWRPRRAITALHRDRRRHFHRVVLITLLWPARGRSARRSKIAFVPTRRPRRGLRLLVVLFVRDAARQFRFGGPFGSGGWHQRSATLSLRTVDGPSLSDCRREGGCSRSRGPVAARSFEQERRRSQMSIIPPETVERAPTAPAQPVARFGRWVIAVVVVLIVGAVGGYLVGHANAPIGR